MMKSVLYNTFENYLNMYLFFGYNNNIIRSGNPITFYNIIVICAMCILVGRSIELHNDS